MMYNSPMYPNGGQSFYQPPQYTGQGFQNQSYFGNSNNNMQMIQNQTPQMQLLKGRPVSSFDEAKASIIDMDGSLFVFTDLANKRIYTKQINLDGNADIKTYALIDENKKEKTEHNNEYVLKSDFEKAIDDMNNKINDFWGGMTNECKRKEHSKHDDETI